MKDTISRKRPQKTTSDQPTNKQLERKIDRLMKTVQQLSEEVKTLVADSKTIKANLDEAKKELLEKIAALQKRIDEGADTSELAAGLTDLADCVGQIKGTSTELKDHVSGSPEA